MQLLDAIKAADLAARREFELRDLDAVALVRLAIVVDARGATAHASTGPQLVAPEHRAAIARDMRELADKLDPPTLKPVGLEADATQQGAWGGGR